MVCSVSMMILNIYWLSSSVLHKLPRIDRANLFNKRKVKVECEGGHRSGFVWAGYKGTDFIL